MTGDPFVPADFSPPTAFATDDFHLEPLGPRHNEADRAAWMSSIGHIRASPGFPDGDWPPINGMTLEANLADLRRHAEDFAARRGFTFTVLDPLDNDVIGCVYLYPAEADDHDVTVQSWVRASRAELDVPLADAVAAWLAADWPWSRLDRAGRMSTRFFDAVRACLGADAADDSDEARARYGHNRLPGGDRLPDGVVMPASTEEVAAIVRLAGEHGVTLWPTSTGHNFGLGEYSPVRSGQVVVHLGRRMNRILEVDERLGYAVVEPGVTFRQLRAELARRGDALMISGTSGPPDGSILGNALDRGAGYTPYFDHFGMLCGLEVVLPDGSVLHTGDGTLAGSRNRFVNKSGFGPLLDGLFSQSNYGIVTRAAIWLMPRPPVIRGFAFAFPDDGDLAEIIELVRPLKLNNAVPTLVKVTSDVYGFATEETYPYQRTGGAVPLPDDLRHELRTKHRTGAWLVSGALYGPSEEAVAPGIDRLRAHFEASGRATYVPHEEMVANPVHKIHIDTFSGEPTDRELGLLDWRTGGGATWFLPATPMIGEVAQTHQLTSRRILAEHGFEYAVEFVCGPRAARALHIVIFNREDPDEAARMNAAYDALVAAYDELGCPIGRAPTDRQEWAMDRLPDLRRVTSNLKSALDPKGVLAPGKYGIS